jgi:signal transduction histidine kinase
VRYSLGRTYAAIMAVNVTKALQHALSQVRALGNRKHVVFELDCPRTLPSARGKSLQLERLLRALLTHAIRVSASGGVVQVFATASPHRAGGASDSVAVVVVDTGAAMQRRGFDRLLSAFRPSSILQLQQVLGGAKILSLTCRLGQLDRGRVWVKSNAGRGSMLAAVLPVTRRRRRFAQPPPGARPVRVMEILRKS